MQRLGKISLRQPTLADVPELARMHVASWMATYRGVMTDEDLASLTPEGFEKFHAMNFHPADKGGGLADPRRVFEVACRAGPDGQSQIVGFVRAGPNRPSSPRGDPLPRDVFDGYAAELYAIYILPEYFGSGLGRLLLSSCIQGLRQRTLNSLCVWVLENNQIGRRFYERLNGRIVGTAPFTLSATVYPQVAYGWPGLPNV